MNKGKNSACNWTYSAARPYATLKLLISSLLFTLSLNAYALEQVSKQKTSAEQQRFESAPIKDSSFNDTVIDNSKLELLSVTNVDPKLKYFDQSNPFKLALFTPYDLADSIIAERLSIDPLIQFTNQLDHAQSIILHDVDLPFSTLDQIKEQVKSGKGLIVIAGPQLSSTKLKYLLEKDIEVIPANPEQKEDTPGFSIAYQGTSNHPLAEIAWKSSVQVYDHSFFKFEKSESIFGIVSSSALVKQTNQPEETPILMESHLGLGKVYLFSPWIQRGNDEERKANLLAILKTVEGDYNYSLYNWSYFNWMLHFLVNDASQQVMPAYKEWKYSPVPKRRHIVFLTLIVLATFSMVVVLFLWVRSYSKRNPSLVNDILLKPSRVKNKHTHRGDNYRGDKKNKNRYKRFGPRGKVGRLIGSVVSQIKSDNQKWEVVGFQRPLAAYMLVVSGIVVGFIPLLIVMHFQLSNFTPFPQAMGIQHWVTLAFGFAFTVFDLGTSVAMIKYFAQYRVDDPAKAMKYIQFYLWFQLFTGVIQLGVLSILVAIYVPSSDYAFLSWILIVHTLIQFPGFVIIFRNIFQALQRFDLMLALFVLRAPLVGLVGVVFTLAARSWGLHHPRFGEVFGAAIGGGISAFFAQWIILAISILFYKQIGYSIKTIFLAHFDWDTVKRSLSYGLKILPGQIAPVIALCAEPIILSYYLDNYLEIISMLIAVLWINGVIHSPGNFLNHNLLPSISESYSHGYLSLCRLYIDQGIRWYLVFFLSLLPGFVVFGSDIFVAIVPEQWSRAADLMSIGLMVGLSNVIAKMPDETFKGAGFPHFYTFTNILEHGLRLILMIQLIPQFGAAGMLYSYIAASLVKGIIAWYLLHRYIFSQKISWWQSIIAPILGSGIILSICGVFYTVLGIDTPQEALPLVLLFVLLVPFAFFLNGLLGGFDDEALEEFNKALALNLATRTFGKLFYFSTVFGAKISPLHGRFTSVNWKQAKIDIEALSKEKVALAAA